MSSFMPLMHQITEQQNTTTEGMDKGRKEGVERGGDGGREGEQISPVEQRQSI